MKAQAVKEKRERTEYVLPPLCLDPSKVPAKTSPREGECVLLPLRPSALHVAHYTLASGQLGKGSTLF